MLGLGDCVAQAAISEEIENMLDVKIKIDSWNDISLENRLKLSLGKRRLSLLLLFLALK